MNSEQLRCIVCGYVIGILRKSRRGMERNMLFAGVCEALDGSASDSETQAAFNWVLERDGVFVGVGDKVVFSEKGRMVSDLMTKKIAVAELIGEKGEVELSEEEKAEVRRASSFVPG